MEKYIIKMAKSMKKEFVEITPNYIVGTDINRYTLSIIYQGSPDYFIGTIQELEGKTKLPDYWVDHEILKREIYFLKQRTLPILNVEPVFKCDNLKDDESFVNILSKKTTDGANIYNLNTKHMMYIFSSLHPVNKTDSISCTIYPYDITSYVAHFVIDKRKYQIHEFIRYLYL